MQEVKSYYSVMVFTQNTIKSGENRAPLIIKKKETLMDSFDAVNQVVIMLLVN